jgi:hypothetical protein
MNKSFPYFKENLELLKFNAKNHSYSLSGKKIKFISVSAMINLGEKPFNVFEQSRLSSKNPKSPWYGLEPEEIRLYWQRIANLGTNFHSYYEENVNNIHNPIIQKIVKIIEEEIQENISDLTIFNEVKIYSISLLVAGTTDIVVYSKKQNKFFIFDLKTNKKLNADKVFTYFKQLLMYRLLLKNCLDENLNAEVEIGGIIHIPNTSNIIFEEEKKNYDPTSLVNDTIQLITDTNTIYSLFESNVELINPIYIKFDNNYSDNIVNKASADLLSKIRERVKNISE